jgi:hypothetical protein
MLYTSFYAYLRSIKNTDMGKSERHKHKRIISPGNIYIYIYVVVEKTFTTYLFTVFL